MKPNEDKTGVFFGMQTDVPQGKGNVAERREYDKKIGSGTMSRSGITCPCCGTIMMMEDIRLEGQAGRLGAVMTSVVVDGEHSKEYRLPTSDEILMAAEAEKEISSVFDKIPFGLPEEPTPKGGSGASRAFSVDGYGLDKWYKLFTPRQLVALGTFVKYTRAVRDAMPNEGYSQEWIEAVSAYLAGGIDKLTDYIASLCTWHVTGEKMSHVFVRFALPVNWDYAELNPLSNSSGNYWACMDWVSRVIEDNIQATQKSLEPHVLQQSAIVEYGQGQVDVIVTDPPYYDAIPYSDLMDFFYVWLRRSLFGLSSTIDTVFHEPLSPKWNNEHNDGELIDDSSRFSGDKAKSKAVYEDGMFRAFQACHKSLSPDGSLVIVFAHKHPDAWETLVSAIIRAGFVVDASWPIQTEMGNRTRALSSAALSSSIWLVCKKRPETAKPGWDNQVLQEMQAKITQRLHDFWDAGIRGPDFVWAATGPALEAYSEHPIVKKSNEPGKILSVSEFLRHVRRMVVDFVVGRVLSHNGGTDAVSGLDDVTTYYLLHRYDFGLDSAPIGPCILYAVSCGLSDAALTSRYDLLARTGGQTPVEEEAVAGSADEGVSEVQEEGTSSTVKLKQWYQRKNPSMGYETLVGPPAPLIDQVHRLMHLWKAGDVTKVDDYLYTKGLGHNALFHQLLQALIELAPAGSEERALLESISNHVAARGVMPAYRLGLME